MRWSKLTIALSNINIHRQVNSEFSEIYNKNNQPAGMFLFQADPHYFVDYYISYKKTDSWMVSEFKKKYKTIDVPEPDTSKLFLVVGEKNPYKIVPLIR